MHREVSLKAKQITSASIKEANTFDDVKVKPEHIVLSILMDDDNDCVKAFNLLNINTIELYDRIADHLRKNDITPRITRTTNNRKKLPFSDDVRIIFRSLDKECESLNDEVIDVIHIMLAILTKPTITSKILSEIYGVNYNSFKKTIKDMKNDFNRAYDSDEQEESEGFKKKPKQTDGKTKTPVLDNFCRDISKAVDKGEIDPVVGRTIEIKRVSQILSRRKKNNPILIGEPGVGKTSVV